MPSIPKVAITSTVAMVSAAKVLGVDPEPILRDEGVGAAVLTDPDARIPLANALRIWEQLANAAGDPYLPLTAPSLLPPGAYRILDFLAAAMPTLGDWIESFTRHYRVVTPAVDLRVGWSDGMPYLDMRLASGGAVVPQFVDYTFAALIARTRLKGYPTWEPSLVEFRHPAERHEPYVSALHSPVRFDADRDRLWCKTSDWSMPSAEANPPLSQLLDEHARLLGEAVPTDGGFVRSVRKAIGEVLQTGATAEDVAAKLYISTRTLQRRLTQRGTTYKAVLEDVREDLARGYLDRSDIAISEVAFILGYSEQSSFNRAFKRWTGAAPGDWRRRSRVQ